MAAWDDDLTWSGTPEPPEEIYWAHEMDDEPEQPDEPTEQPCGCPLEYHLADCDGFKAPTKQDYLEMYKDLDVEDWPDTEG